MAGTIEDIDVIVARAFAMCEDAAEAGKPATSEIRRRCEVLVDDFRREGMVLVVEMNIDGRLWPCSIKITPGESYESIWTRLAEEAFNTSKEWRQ